MNVNSETHIYSSWHTHTHIHVYISIWLLTCFLFFFLTEWGRTYTEDSSTSLLQKSPLCWSRNSVCFCFLSTFIICQLQMWTESYTPFHCETVFRFAFLAHLTWKHKWVFLIACDSLSVCPSVNFSHFLLLQNH